MKPSVGKSIFFSFIAIIAFYISLIICTAVLSFVLALFLKIPVLKSLVLLFLHTTENTGTSFVVYLALVLSAIFVSWLLTRIHDEDATLSLTYRISAVVLFAISILSVISAIKENSAIYGSLLLVVCSVIAFIYGNKLKSKVSAAEKSEKTVVDHISSNEVYVNPELDDTTKKEETRVLTEAWDGSPVWVPESRLEAYRKAQDELKKSGGRNSETDELAEKIYERLKESSTEKKASETEQTAKPLELRRERVCTQRYSKERLDSILGKRINPYNRKMINTIEDLIEYDLETCRRIQQQERAELEKSEKM